MLRNPELVERLSLLVDMALPIDMVPGGDVRYSNPSLVIDSTRFVFLDDPHF